jgi:lipopolysaccharide transport system ATP-binding protein
MKEELALCTKNVSKKFCKSLRKSMLYGIKDIGKNMVGLGTHSEKLRKNEFWAVDDINIDLKKGETLGIIGPNGSGKTTLLKMMNGIFWPDKGKITIRGKTGALIAVGSGFHLMLTGRENIYINGAILGLSKKEVDEKIDEIIEFADIGEFIDYPVKFYSSGMFIRLGFSVAVTAEPEILLIDEVLAVGDLAFQNKSFQRLGQLKEKSNAAVFVSHNLNHIRNLCDKVMILNRGKQFFYGDTQEAIIEYYKLIGEEKLLKIKEKGISYFEHFSSGDILFHNSGIFDNNESQVDTIAKGEDIVCYFDFELKDYKEELFFAVGILDENRKNSILQYSHDNNLRFCQLSKGKYRLVVRFENPNLSPGIYSSSFAIRDKKTGATYERIIGLNPFSIKGEIIPRATIHTNSQWKLSNFSEKKRL